MTVSDARMPVPHHEETCDGFLTPPCPPDRVNTVALLRERGRRPRRDFSGGHPCSTVAPRAAGAATGSGCRGRPAAARGSDLGRHGYPWPMSIAKAWDRSYSGGADRPLAGCLGALSAYAGLTAAAAMVGRWRGCAPARLLPARRHGAARGRPDHPRPAVVWSAATNRRRRYQADRPNKESVASGTDGDVKIDAEKHERPEKECQNERQQRGNIIDRVAVLKRDDDANNDPQRASQRNSVTHCNSFVAGCCSTLVIYVPGHVCRRLCVQVGLQDLKSRRGSYLACPSSRTSASGCVHTNGCPGTAPGRGATNAASPLPVSYRSRTTARPGRPSSPAGRGTAGWSAR
jgi:hypothetical protein